MVLSDLSIKRPVFATVMSLLLGVLGRNDAALLKPDVMVALFRHLRFQ